MTASFTIRAAVLKEALDRVKHAAASDEGRPILAAIAIQPHAEGIRLVATDNYRIALMTLEVEATGDWPESIIPTRALRTISALLLANRKTSVEVSRIDDHVRIATSYDAVEVRVMDGIYPDVDAVIPEEAAEIVSLNPRYLADLKYGMKGAAFATLRLLDQQHAAVFRDPRGDYTEIIMPARTVSPSEL